MISNFKQHIQRFQRLHRFIRFVLIPLGFVVVVLKLCYLYLNQIRKDINYCNQRYFPAGSYINAMDFDSPESLANYLKKLMTDDELYLSYFRWRRKYVVDLAPKDSWCQLCQMLRNQETKTYDDIGAWWSGESINQTCSLSPPKSLVGAGKS